jgi:AhpD family alkylhydroperoxidase
VTAIELIDAGQAPLLVRRHFEGGDPGALVAALAHVPEICEVALPLFATVLGPTSLPVRLKEVVVLRTSVTGRCRFCVDSHTVVAWDSGLSGEEVAALRGEAPWPPTLSLLERDAARFADLMWERPEGAVDVLRPHLEDHAIVEMVMLSSTTMLLNRLCTALALPVAPAVAARLAAAGL